MELPSKVKQSKLKQTVVGLIQNEHNYVSRQTQKVKGSISRIPDPVDDRDVSINLAAMHSTVPYKPTFDPYTTEHLKQTDSIRELEASGSMDFRP